MSSRLSRATWLRLTAVLLFSVLVHLMLIGALPGLPDWHQPSDAPLIASIEPPQQPAPVELPLPLPLMPRAHVEKSATAVQSVEPVERSAAPADPKPVLTQADGPTTPVETGPDNGPMTATASAGVSAAPALPVAPAARIDAPSQLPVPPAPPASRPVDANLSYRVTALDPSKPNQQYAGQGALIFHSDQSSYHASLQVNAQALFVSISVLTSVSDGTIAGDGLEPGRYSESRRNRSTGVATFARLADGTSDLSSTEGKETVRAPAGVQDRLTVLLQIGALMQANPAMKHAGVNFAIPVAGEHGGLDIWNFTVLGEEQVRTDVAAQAGWHVRRVVRPGTNDRGLDIWVESAAPHLPLRVLYTDPGDKTIDLVLASEQSPLATSPQ
jgi:hypothetical protein